MLFTDSSDANRKFTELLQTTEDGGDGSYMDWGYVVENVRRILGETIKPKKSCQACKADITEGGYLIGWNELCEGCAKKAADLLVAK